MEKEYPADTTKEPYYVHYLNRVTTCTPLFTTDNCGSSGGGGPTERGRPSREVREELTFAFSVRVLVVSHSRAYT